VSEPAPAPDAPARNALTDAHLHENPIERLSKGQQGVSVSLEKALSEMMKNVPECIAVGWVDMNTGMLLGVKTVDSHPQEVLDLVAAATTDIFQGTNVSAIEKLFKKSRGVPDNGEHYFKEIVVLSENLLHVFSRGKKKPDQVLVSVSRISANLGMVLTKVRSALPAIEVVG
jgi:hypothetical protein